MSNRFRIEVMVLVLLIGVLVGSRAMAWYNASYTLFDPLVDIHHSIQRNYVEEPNNDHLMRGAIEGMVAQLKDPHTAYLPPRDFEQFNEFATSSYSGIGAQVTEEDGWLVITTPMEDSPAYKAGIMSGDVVLEINGESAEGIGLQAGVDKIKGEPGTTVTLKIRHEDGVEKVLHIKRGNIKVQTVKGFRRTEDLHWDFILDPDDAIAYIRITTFSEPTADALKKAVQTALDSGMKGLILDLRFNPGGILQQAVAMSDLFLSEGTIVSSKGRNRRREEWKATPANDMGHFPIVVLINEESASASEILAGALKDNERAIVLGARSFGKGSVQEVYELEDGNGAFKLTTAWYYLPSGRKVHRQAGSDEWGVDPNEGFYIPMTGEQVREMFNQRQQTDLAAGGRDDLPETMSAQYLKENLADPQLAAAYTAMKGKLENGSYTPVSEVDNERALKLIRKSALQERRRFIQLQLEAVEEQLQKLDEVETEPAEPLEVGS